MKKLSLITAILAASVLPAAASGWARSFDCGDDQIVSIIEYHENLDVSISAKAGLDTFSYSLHWDQDKEQFTLDGRQCRQMTDDEVRKKFPQEGN